MDFGEDEKAAGEILRSLLTPKMENSMETDLNDWGQLEQKLQNGHFQPQQQTIWQVETNLAEKHQFVASSQNVIQQIPLTYLTTNERNITVAGVVKPFTYLVSRNVVGEPAKYGGMNESEESIVLNESSKIVLVQNVESSQQSKSNVNKSQEHCIVVQENKSPTQTKKTDCENIVNDSENNMTIEEQTFTSDKCESLKKSEFMVINRKGKRKLSGFEEVLSKSKKSGSGKNSHCLTKLKVERKISGCKKSLKKKKNAKLKSKLKTIGKCLLKKPMKSVKTIEDEDKDDMTKRNLFELTKLEDNVDQVAERLKIGCDCADTNCFDGLNPDKVFKHRLNIADLTKAEHDMYLMGVIMASVQNLEETCRHKERIRIRSCYAYQGKKVCLTAFLYLQHVTLYQMKRLRSHLKNHGVSPRTHGNRGRKPANTFSLDIYHCATNFVQSYIEKHCVKSVPNFTTFSYGKSGENCKTGVNFSGANSLKKSNKMKIANKINSYHLPSECTKKTVHREYKSFCENSKPSQKAMKYSTFTSFLQKQFPNVKFHKVDKKVLQEKCCSSDRTKSGVKTTTNESTVREDAPNKINDKTVEDYETFADKYVQTPVSLVHVSAKTFQSTQPATVLVTPKLGSQVYGRTQLVGTAMAVKNSQILLNGKQLQLVGGGVETGSVGGGNGSELEMDLRFSNRVLIGNPIYGTQCFGQTTRNAQQIFITDQVT